MAKITIHALAFSALSLTAALPASAAFTTSDWATVGDKGMITDTTTGKQWLNGYFTTVQNTTQIMERLAVGGDLYGWRVATSSEVSGLLSQFWTAESLNPFSSWTQNMNTQFVGYDTDFLDFHTQFGGNYGYQSTSLLLSSVGYHRSDVTHTPDYPWARTGFQTNYALHDQSGTRVSVMTLGSPGEDTLGYKTSNNSAYAPNLETLRQKYVFSSYNDYGFKHFNTALQGYETPLNNTFWWLVNDFATSKVQSQDPALPISPDSASDVSSTLPLSLAGFSLLLLARLPRRRR